MDISQRGIDMIVSYEGKHKLLSDGRYGAYLDRLAKPPVWTIYCGLTRGVHSGMVCSSEQGDKLFAKELAIYEDAVERLIAVDLNQNQFDAMVSFTYNCGVGALQTSTLRKLLNQGKYEQVPAQLMRWVNAGGKKYKGLERRRAAEGALFMTPMPLDEPEIVTIDFDGIPDRIENPMPQRIEEAPAGSPAQASKQSWTIRGAVLAFLATIGDKAVEAYNWTFGVAKDAGAELLTLKQTVGPFDTILVTMKTALPVLALVGIVIVVARRLSAAKEGKIG
jgi:lysozyme